MFHETAKPKPMGGKDNSHFPQKQRNPSPRSHPGTSYFNF
jgi:hypothetical protein